MTFKLIHEKIELLIYFRSIFKIKFFTYFSFLWGGSSIWRIYKYCWNRSFQDPLKSPNSKSKFVTPTHSLFERCVEDWVFLHPLTYYPSYRLKFPLPPVTIFYNITMPIYFIHDYKSIAFFLFLPFRFQICLYLTESHPSKSA